LSRYPDLARAEADLSALSNVAIARRPIGAATAYLTLVANADARKVVCVSKARAPTASRGVTQQLPRGGPGILDRALSGISA